MRSPPSASFLSTPRRSLSLTARSAWLRSDASPTLHHAARYWTTPGNWAAWGAFGMALRTGACPFEAVLGQPSFDYLRDHPEEAALFDAFMRHSPDDRHAAVAKTLDLAAAGLVVDVGGGDGGLLAALLSANAWLRGVPLRPPARSLWRSGGTGIRRCDGALSDRGRRFLQVGTRGRGSLPHEPSAA